MTSPLYLGIDQGSSSTKGVLVDASGGSVADFQVAVPPRIEIERTVEQDAEGLLSSVVEVFLKAKQWAQDNGATVAAAGLAVQRPAAATVAPLLPLVSLCRDRAFSPGGSQTEFRFIR